MSQTQDGLTVSGTFTGSASVTFLVEIDNVLGLDTFKWRDVQSTYNATGVGVSTSPISLSNGLTITFTSLTGHDLGESWSWTSEPNAGEAAKDGVIVSKDGTHNLITVSDGAINVINQIVSPDGLASSNNRATSSETAMTVHNKETHIGHGTLPSTWAGYIKNTQWGSKFEDFYVTDAAIRAHSEGGSGIAFLDYLVSDGTYLWGAKYRGNELYRIHLTTYAVTINRIDYKEICGITYVASGLYVLNCDSEEHDNYTLFEITAETMDIAYRHSLTGIDFDDVDNVVFSDIITTNAKIWYAVYSPTFIDKEIVLWNSPIPSNDDADLALTNRSPGILKGATDGNGKATEGWMDLEFHNYTEDLDATTTVANPVDVKYTRTYKRSLINTGGSAVVGWLCRYKPHTSGQDGVWGGEIYDVQGNTFYIGTGDKWTHFGEDPKIINAVTEAHVAGDYASNTAHLYPVLFPLGDNSSMLYSSNTASLYVCDNTKKIVRYLTSTVNFSTITSKAYTNSPETGIDTTTVVSSLVLGATTEGSGLDLLYAIKREDFPAIDHITFTLSGTAWSSYVEDFSSATPLVLTFTLRNDDSDTRGDDASQLNGAIDADDETIEVDDISLFAFSGTVIIDPEGDKELVTYTGVSLADNTLTGCTRESFGTGEHSHADNETVVQAYKRYFWKVSYTYDGYQESPLVSFLSPVAGLASGAPNFDVVLTHKAISTLNKRITHINLYRADNTDLSKDEPEGFFRLVESIPLNDGGWDINNNTDIAVYTVEDTGSVTVAYDARTSISEVIPSTSINYGLSTEINSTLIIGRGSLEEIDDADQYLFKSKVNKYDIFDWTVDLLKLPRVPTALASFSGRIYAFDENNTYKINPSGLYIEDTFEGVGCVGPKAVVVTEFGMFFCDGTNIYLHNGTSPTPIGNPIVRGDDNYAWQNRDTSFVPIVGFEPKRGSFLVFFKPTGVSGYFAWAYNLARKRWDLWEFHATYVPQCVIAGPSGEVYVGTDITIVDYLSGAGFRTWEYQTKEITMGADTQNKRFYKIRKVGTATVTYGVNDSTPVQTLTAEAIQAAHKKSQSIKIKATSQVGEIDSLGIVYRRLPVK